MAPEFSVRTSEADTLFRLADVSVEYLPGTPAVEGIDLRVPRGDALAIVGPSGSGKTTLLRLLNGTLAPTRGAIQFEGIDLAAISPRALRSLRSRIGFVHQEHSLVPNLRVSQNVIAGKLGRRGALASLRSLIWPTRGDLERAHAILERIGIPEKLFARTDTLSGGQKQRAALARALFQNPAALLADEPLASIDPARGRSLMELMRRLAEEQGLTLIISLHDLAIAREFFPRIIGLRRGRVAFDRAPSEVDESEYEALYRLEERE